MNIHNHGDLVFRPIENSTVPSTAITQKLWVLQDSGATGNRHEVVGDAIAHWFDGEKEYIHSDAQFNLQHVGGDEEHGVQNMEAGTWEILHEVEYDPWKNELRIVID
jgi:hypothetical protein